MKKLLSSIVICLAVIVAVGAASYTYLQTESIKTTLGGHYHINADPHVKIDLLKNKIVAPGEGSRSYTWVASGILRIDDDFPVDDIVVNVAYKLKFSEDTDEGMLQTVIESGRSVAFEIENVLYGKNIFSDDVPEFEVIECYWAPNRRFKVDSVSVK